MLMTLFWRLYPSHRTVVGRAAVSPPSSLVQCGLGTSCGHFIVTHYLAHYCGVLAWQLTAVCWLLSADSWGDVDSGAVWVTLHWAHCLSRHGHQPRCHSYGGIISSLLLLMKRNFETFVCNCILQLVWIKIQIRDSYKLITNFSCFIFVTAEH